jgi:CRISPR-associated protein Cas5h
MSTDSNILDGTPRLQPTRCLSLTVRGQWGHFRRIDGTVVKQTYRVMPRTTVAGLLAAIVGVGFDRYYETFALDKSAIAITPVGDLRTTNFGVNHISTTNEDMSRPSGKRSGSKLEYPNSSRNRQQYNYELLVDPEYRIDVYVEDRAFYEALKERLQTETSVYTPTLGRSECLATIESHGMNDESFEFECAPVAKTGAVPVESAVPNGFDALQPTTETHYATERSPAEMTTEGAGAGKRRTVAFHDYVYTTDGSPLDIRADQTAVTLVGDRPVVFG